MLFSNARPTSRLAIVYENDKKISQFWKPFANVAENVSVFCNALIFVSRFFGQK